MKKINIVFILLFGVMIYGCGNTGEIVVTTEKNAAPDALSRKETIGNLRSRGTELKLINLL